MSNNTSNPQPPSEEQDELLLLLNKAIHAYVFTKRRYPLLLATTKELDALIDHLKLTRVGGRRPGIWNDAVLQVVRDSFDMLVIDLASIRESLIEKNGLLHRLRAECNRLRRYEPSEFAARPVMIVSDNGDDTDNARVETEVQQYGRELVANSINDALARLIPDEFPVTSKGVEALIKRFIKETEPLDKDRNHVRAHRYEYRNFDRKKYFQPLDNLQDQLDIIERLLRDLYLVLTKTSYHLDLRFQADTKRTAEGLADFMVHGSVNEAVNAYGVVQKTTKGPAPWYYACRQRFFESRSAPEKSEEET
jgi:hypothetical protein